ncbi:phosphatidylinositol N-acetylglucosaminyltransferase subunit C-like [Physella acuta]|uniref:phosphatidylinositol N-acetylglucosaminyltransferase subunit C-like n=1 Tax=Physella acuta TaxID=109671 RepID=UPI0027DEAAA6|nr:phosphatidylinositol N-acetylglucosaminyltransferase subunit C-like [Physella acuta]
MVTKRPWRKILYEEQDYPDNYVDRSFLEELRKNLHVCTYDYTTLLFESTSITQQISSIGIFITMFFYMEDHSISAQILWLMMSALTIIGYICNVVLTTWLGQTLSVATFLQHLKTCLLFQGFSATLSPVLVSLTETISTDTIYAMTTVMLFANLLFYNYNCNNHSVPGALSLNAAIFASVCLASRLHTTWHAFTTVTTSFQLFALWPVLRQNIKVSHPRVHTWLTLFVAVICIIGLGSKTIVGAVLYTLIIFLVTFIFPAWFCSLQPQKNNIYGPWDEAVISEPS